MIVPPSHDRISLGRIVKGGPLHQGALPEEFWWRDDARARHCLLIGGSGSGKSVEMHQMMFADSLRGAPYALIDPFDSVGNLLLESLAALNAKMAMRERTKYRAFNRRQRALRELYFQKYVVLDFTTTDINGFRWNPLEISDGLDASETVGDFQRSLARVLGSLTEMRRLQMVTRAVLTILVEHGALPGNNGTTLRDSLDFLCLGQNDIETYIRELDRRSADGKLKHRVRPDVVRKYLASFFSQTTKRERRELTQSCFNALGMILADETLARFIGSPKSRS